MACSTSMLSAQISGTVFADLDGSGNLTANEPGQEGVTITAFDENNQSAAQTSSAADGSYTLSVPPGQYRLHFSDLGNAFAGPSGAGSSTEVTFVNGPASNVNFGLMRPDQFCEANPTIVIPCYVNGDPLDTEGISLQNQTAVADVLVSTSFNATGQTPAPGHIAVGEELGAIWGLAYQPQSQSLFSAAVIKRHTGLAALGTGGIYITDMSSSGPSSDPFVDLNTLGINTGADPHQGLTGDKTDASTDSETFGAVAKIGLGDMDISTDGNTLYVVNLLQKEIVALSIGNPPTTPSLSGVDTYAIPNPGCSNGDYRPWALKYYEDALYVGVVCSAETSQSSADLTGIIYEMNLSTGQFTQALSIPLDYDKGCTDLNYGCSWNPWTDNPADLVIAGTNRLVYPQPIISDIEFDSNGNMLIGMMDRTGHQTGRANLVPGVTGIFNGFASGDLLKAANQNGSFVLESNGTLGAISGCGANTGQGPGGGEFFCEDNWNDDLHEEVVVGGLAYLAGANEVVSSVFDPLDQFYFSGGLHWYDNGTGQRTDGYLLYQNNDPGTLGKATGIGDVELLCGVPEIEIGNRVWADTNGNGIQDPGELGLANVEVLLLDENGTQITSTQSNAQGEYLFTGLNAFTTYIVAVETGANVNNFPPSPANNASGAFADHIDSDGAEGQILNAVAATITTGQDGNNDHSVDFGFVYSQCEELSIVVAVTCEETVEGGDGSAIVTYEGAVEPVSILWSTGETSDTATGLSAPLDYSVTVTDAANCSVTYEFVMCEATCDLDLSLESLTQISCAGEADASATLSIEGIDSGLVGYTWFSNGENLGIIGNQAQDLAAGTYVVSAANQSGCEVELSFTIEEPDALSVLTCDSQPASSASASDGNLTVFATGGTGSYTFELNGTSSSSGTFDNLAVGEYTITITDQEACSTTTTCTVSGPDCNILLAVMPTATQGCEQENGSLQISFQGNDAPVDIYYMINSGLEQLVDSGVTDSPYLISNLGAANYTVRVETASCEATAETVSVQGAEPSVNFQTVEAGGGSCGDENASIVITANGNEPLSYSIDGGQSFQTSNTFENVALGTYDIVVADANDCEQPYGEPFVVSGSAGGLSVSNVQVQNVFCAGDADGKITLSISGGSPPYELSSDGGTTFQMSDNFNNLEAGYYELVVMDATGCQISAGFAEVEGPAIPLEVLDVTVTDVDCFGGGNGTLTVLATGGTEPYQYSLDAGEHFLDVSFVENLGMGTYDILVRDANYCTATWPVTVQIGGDPLTITDVQFTDIPCGGSATTTMTIEASGGFGDLLYSIDEGNTYQTSNVFDEVSAGSYLVYIKDENDCPLAYGPPVIVGGGDENFRIANVSYTQVMCTGANDASITITGDGGVPPYMYSIDNGETYQDSNLFENVGPGIYMAVLEDGNGCMSGYDELIEISEPAIPLQIRDLQSEDVSCPGEQDGFIQVTALGGIEPYTFSIDGGTTFSNSGIFEQRQGGEYIVIVEDANGCTETFETVVNIQEAPPISIQEVQATDALCFGQSNGSIVIFAAGGFGELLYSIDGGAIYQTSGTFLNIPAGSYDVKVKDENDCYVDWSSQTIVGESPQLSMEFESTDITICDGNNGTISITADGGLPPYQYTIDNRVTFQNTGDYDGLAAGVYVVDVVDANGCSVEDEVIVINEPADFEIVFVDYEDLTTCGADDGWLVIYTAGGELPLEFSIDGGETFALGNEFTDLSAGDYEITVKDALGCSKSGGMVTISGPSDIVIDEIIAQNPTCANNVDGTITIEAHGGDFPLEYSIDGGLSHQYSNVFENVGPGSYEIIVRSGFLCSVEGPVQTMMAPPAIEVLSVTTNNISCNGNNDGQISILAGGGGAQLYYSIDNGDVFSTGNTFSGLPAGIYQIKVRDANGCFADFEQVVEISDPEPLQVFVNTTNPTTCGGTNGVIEIAATGGTGEYSYSIDGGAHFNDVSLIEGLISGAYSVVVRDENGCHYFDTELTVLEQPQDIHIVAVNAQDVDCNGGENGSITIYAGGGTGVLLYSIDGGENFSTDNVFENLAIGQYDIIVSDQALCDLAYTTPIVIGDPSSSIVIAGVQSTNLSCHDDQSGSILIEASGGTGSLGYSIDGGITFHIVQNQFDHLEAGLYAVVVRDANGCTSSWNQIVNLAQPEDLLLTIESVEHNDCFGEAEGSIELEVIGGIPPYQYSIDDGLTYQDSPIFTGLVEGIYYAETLDANGCNFGEPTPVSIEAPLDLQILDIIVADQSCSGEDSGVLEIIAGGGQGEISYSIDGGANYSNNSIFNNLQIGTYNVLVKDENECITAAGEVAVNGANPIQISQVLISDVTDCEAANGSISFVVTGGTGALQYSIDGGQSVSFDPLFEGLSAGNYQPLVIDQNACSVSANELTIGGLTSVEFGDPVVTDASQCGGSDGVIQVIVSTDGNLQYSIDGGSTYSDDSVFSGLSEGEYQIVVRDDNACITSFGNPVIVNAPPAVFISDIQVSNLSCADAGDGEILVVALGGDSNLEYSIDAGLNWQSNSIFEGLAAGQFSVWVRSGDNCIAQADELVTIASPAAISAPQAEVNDLTCPDSQNGEIIVFSSGGVGELSYSIDGGSNFSSTSTFDGLSAGVYMLLVADEMGCQSSIVEVTVGASEPLISTANIDQPTCGSTVAEVTISISNSAGEFEFSADLGTTYQSSPILSLEPGIYTIWIRDNDGCVHELTGGDIEILAPSGCGSIGDTVFTDTNANGIQDAGEQGIQGVIVQLYDAAGLLLDSAITDENGNYLFENLAPGEYTVVLDTDSLPSGYTLSTPSQFNVNLGENENFLDADFGIYGAACLGDSIFIDQNENGMQDVEDSAFVGAVTVILYDGNGQQINQLVTENGSYSFCGLEPGIYSVELIAPEAYGLTTPSSFTVTLSSGEDILNLDFGLTLENTVIANDDQVSTEFETPITIVVTSNDTDPDGDTFSVTDYTEPLNGTVTINQDGTITYTPNDDFCGVDSFTYTITDSEGNSDTAEVTVIVACEINEGPDAVDDFVNTSGDTPVVISPLENDSHPEGDTFTICGYSQPLNGTVVQVGEEFVYEPNPGFEGVDTFTYTICDSDGNEDTATVFITVDENPCDPEVISICTEPLSPTLICPEFCSLGDDFTLTSVNTSYTCGVEMEGDCLVFTSVPGIVPGFVYEVSLTACSDTECETISIFIQVGNCNGNTSPVAIMDEYQTVWNNPIVVDVLNNDYDPDGGEVIVCDFFQPTHGFLEMINGQLVYTPQEGYTGVDHFSYQICDEDGGIDLAIVTITIDEPGACPATSEVLVPDVYKICVTGYIKALQTVAPVVPPGYQVVYLLTSSSDFTIQQISTVPSFGPMLNGGFFTVHSLVYDPATFDLSAITFGQTTAFEVNAQLNQGGGDICAALGLAGAEFKVVNCNSAPITVNDLYNITSGSEISFNPLENDLDAEEGELYICDYTEPANGVLQVIGNTMTYSPDAGFIGVETIHYNACDDIGNYGQSTITIMVQEGDCTNPVWSICTAPMETVLICPEYCDLEGDYSITDVQNTFDASIVYNGNCIEYTSVPAFLGSESLVITACDDIQCDTQVIQLTITDDCNAMPNEAPVVGTDQATTTVDTPITLDPVGNDADPEGETLMLDQLGDPDNGSVFATGNEVTYLPDLGFVGQDEFSYTVCDAQGLCTIGVVEVYVQSAIEPTDCTPEPICTPQMTPTAICVEFCDLLADATVVSVTTLYSCSIQDIDQNCFTYIGLPAFTGVELLTIDGCDSAGNCQTISVELTVGDCGLDGNLVDDSDENQIGKTRIVDCEVAVATTQSQGLRFEILEPCYAMEDLHLMIYNLNGSLIYQASGQAALQWNGEAVGASLPTGLYVYALLEGPRVISTGQTIR